MFANEDQRSKVNYACFSIMLALLPLCKHVQICRNIGNSTWMSFLCVFREFFACKEVCKQIFAVVQAGPPLLRHSSSASSSSLAVGPRPLGYLITFLHSSRHPPWWANLPSSSSAATPVNTLPLLSEFGLRSSHRPSHSDPLGAASARLCRKKND